MHAKILIAIFLATIMFDSGESFYLQHRWNMHGKRAAVQVNLPLTLSVNTLTSSDR